MAHVFQTNILIGILCVASITLGVLVMRIYCKYYDPMLAENLHNKHEIESLSEKLNSAHSNIVDYIKRESMLKMQIEKVSINQPKKEWVPMVSDSQLQQRVIALENELKANQDYLVVAAQIIEQLREEIQNCRLLPNHMESYMAALTSANSQIIALKEELKNNYENLATAEQIISQLQDKLAKQAALIGVDPTEKMPVMTTELKSSELQPEQSKQRAPLTAGSLALDDTNEDGKLLTT